MTALGAVQDRHDGIQSSLGSKRNALDLVAEQVEEGLHEECQEGLGRSLQAGHEGRDNLAARVGPPVLTLLAMAAIRSK